MSDVRLTSVTPVLFTDDLAATLRFYTEVLSFTVDTLWPEGDPTLCILDRGPVHLMFTTDSWAEAGGSALPGQLTFETEGVAELHRRIKADAEVVWGPEVYHYGRREFSIRDPNGYRLVFSEPTSDPPTCVEE